MRSLWLLITGVCAASGIWATHFVAMLAFDAGIPTAYDPALTAASLLHRDHSDNNRISVSSGRRASQALRAVPSSASASASCTSPACER